jgi:hypothetical protein
MLHDRYLLLVPNIRFKNKVSASSLPNLRGKKRRTHLKYLVINTRREVLSGREKALGLDGKIILKSILHICNGIAGTEI